LDVPPKIKVKGYMYFQMKKTCGHAAAMMYERSSTKIPLLF
jgi:hypothetical protein